MRRSDKRVTYGKFVRSLVVVVIIIVYTVVVYNDTRITVENPIKVEATIVSIFEASDGGKEIDFVYEAGGELREGILYAGASARPYPEVVVGDLVNLYYNEANPDDCQLSYANDYATGTIIVTSLVGGLFLCQSIVDLTKIIKQRRYKE
jgi:hypothetical protein